ncbi:MAG: lipoyl(octanoyl) transferase LipB [Bacteroidales bacterium]
MSKSKSAAIPVVFRDLGQMPFGEAWKLQQELHSGIVARRRTGPNTAGQAPGPGNDWLLFVEHPHVYTLGKSGKETNLLVDSRRLEAMGASFYHIDRGGDITYHGPGQLVGYPIFDLEAAGLGVKAYIHNIESAIITLLEHYGITATRYEKGTGVWLDTDDPARVRKICAIGVKVSRAITMHGFALNVNTDLSYFRAINPCGFTREGVTSMAVELGKEVDFDEVKENLKRIFAETFGYTYFSETGE